MTSTDTALDTTAALEDILLDQHLHQLRVESAIPDALIAERGYRSITVSAELVRLGFKQRQARTPSLLVPIHGVDGDLAGYAIRPDEPRSGGGGMIKYEMPAGWRQRLDVPPRCRAQLHDPSVALYITEGAKKADSLAALGVCAISLNGVWGWRGTNDDGGKTALADWDLVALNERLVRIVFDSDVSTKKPVRYALVRLKAFLETRGAVVEVVYLPPTEDDRKQGVDDFLAAGGTLADLNEYAVSEIAPAADDTAEIQEVIIVSDRHLRDISSECWQVIEQWNARRTFMFHHGVVLTRIETDGEEGPRLIDINPDSLTFFLERACDFVKLTDDGVVPARLPADVARDLLVTWDKPLPAIRGIVGAPTFTADGVLATNTGYQRETELYYLPVGEAVPPVPDTPTSEDIQRAKQLIFDEWLHDFPFADQASRTHILAIALTSIVRAMIDGPTPLFAIDAPTPGTGKGLLAETIGTLVFGTTPPVMSELRNDEELRKRITSVLLSGAPIVLFDNISKKVASGVFAAALTAPTWSDRRLGGNETVTIPNRATWMITGNNLDLSGEIARRTVWSRIAPDTDRPWERTGFRNFPLPAWVRAHRHELLWSLLVLAQNWIASGKPAWSGNPMGTFESWCHVVGGILEQAGIEGFLANRDELYRNVDTESEEWRAFVAAWWESHTGSYSRHTLIAPLSEADIDVFVVLDNQYFHRFDGASRGQASLLDLLRGALQQTYPQTPDISRNGQAVTVRFSDFVVDVVPGFNRQGGGFLIPDSVGGRWIETDPRSHVELVSSANAAHGGDLVPLIKMVKAWNRTDGRHFRSFHLEVLTLKLLSGVTISDYPSGVRYFMDKARDEIKHRNPDPAGYSGDVGSYIKTGAEIEAASARFQRAYEKAVSAESHAAAGSTADAIGSWRTLLGDHFPAYG